MPPSGVVPRREHDVAVSREHERAAELAHENEVLREYIETQVEERQAVIERYERLLDQQQSSVQAATAPSDSPQTPGTATPLEAVRSTVRSVVNRVRSRLGVR